MSEPTVAGTKPAVMELEAGDYFWCACGLSGNQPFCDSSHAGSGFKPVHFTMEETKRVALCLCKMTTTPPFCDGTHSCLKSE